MSDAPDFRLDEPVRITMRGKQITLCNLDKAKLAEQRCW